MSNHFIVRLFGRRPRLSGTIFPASTSDSSSVRIEMVTEIVKVNMDHARHIEAQRMLLAIGYGVAMYTLLPSTLNYEPDDLIAKTAYSFLGLLVTILSGAMTYKWNEAFTRWIKAAEAVATSMKASSAADDDAGKLRMLFGFKDRENTRASNTFIGNVGASRMFNMLYVGAAAIWVVVIARNLAAAGIA